MGLGEFIAQFVDKIGSILDGVLRTYPCFDMGLMHRFGFERSLIRFPFKAVWLEFNAK